MVLNLYFLRDKAEPIIQDTDRYRKKSLLFDILYVNVYEITRERVRFRKSRSASCCLSLIAYQ